MYGLQSHQKKTGQVCGGVELDSFAFSGNFWNLSELATAE
jgi:hypothetical protein